jgi:hypothetical protein
VQKISKKKGERQKDEAELSLSRLFLVVSFADRPSYRDKEETTGRIQEPAFDRGARDRVTPTVVRAFCQAAETHQGVYRL